MKKTQTVKLQRLDKKLTGRSKKQAKPGRGLDQYRHLERALSSLLSYLQAVQCTHGSQLCELSPVLCVGWSGVRGGPSDIDV